MSKFVPSEEEYIVWRDDPVTRFIMAVCRKTAGEVFDSWVQRSWQADTLDATDHLVARTRSDAYLALEQSDYDDWIAKADTPEADIALPARREADDAMWSRASATGDIVWMAIAATIGIVIGALAF